MAQEDLLRLRIEFYELPNGRTRGEVVSVSDPRRVINHRKEYSSALDAVNESILLLEVLREVFQGQRERKSEEEIIFRAKEIRKNKK